MGNSNSIIKINFESVQKAITNKNSFMINTLRVSNQSCLIQTTLSIEEEVTALNANITKNKAVPIIVYGTNSCDDSVDKKCRQLIGLGFQNIYVYPGGMFEWLLLQDIYGDDLFPTTGVCKDLLEYKNCLTDSNGSQILHSPNQLALLG
tara:strand:+ start:101 stop:547 length:447 start_codon:yes stop_codon:yes gene_type:complete